MTDPDSPEPRGAPGAGPLAGRTIAVTRPREQAEGLATALEARGASVVSVPLIRIVPPTDRSALERAAREVSRFDWVVFTSANGVLAFWRALRDTGRGDPSLEGVRLAAIGPATAAAIESVGARSELVAEEHLAEGMLESLRSRVEVRGRRILLPQAEGARDVLAASLVEAGAEVEQVVAYRSVSDAAGAAEMKRLLAEDALDMVTFTSSSTVQSFVERAGGEPGKAAVATIGPITSRTARSLGLRVDVEAWPYTASGLVEAIVRYYGARSE